MHETLKLRSCSALHYAVWPWTFGYYEEKEQSLKLGLGQPWVWSVSDFIFLVSANEGRWLVLFLSSSRLQCMVSALIIADLAMGARGAETSEDIQLQEQVKKFNISNIQYIQMSVLARMWSREGVFLTSIIIRLICWWWSQPMKSPRQMRRMARVLEYKTLAEEEESPLKEAQLSADKWNECEGHWVRLLWLDLQVALQCRSAS